MQGEQQVIPAKAVQLLRNNEEGNFFSREQLSEAYLKEAAGIAQSEGYLDSIAEFLLASLTSGDKPSREYDWNVGSLVQHADPEVIIRNIPTETQGRERLYESIGLTWCLGEFGRRDPNVISFLQDTVANARNSESWFRAAGSLDQLGVVNSVSYLKTSLKARGAPDLEDCLTALSDYRNMIGVLLHSTVDNLHSRIFPRIEAVLCSDDSGDFEKLGAAWIVGRFSFVNDNIEAALKELVRADSYEMRLYTLHAIEEIASPRFRPLLLRFLDHDDPLLRKGAASGLQHFSDPEVLIALEERLDVEKEGDVIAAITRSLYSLKHPAHQRDQSLRGRIGANENGMIADEEDKWYTNPDIYHIFSESQDPENVSFGVVLRSLSEKTYDNPVDIGSGTGRFASFIRRNIRFSGKVTCLDQSEQMVDFLRARFRREGVPKNTAKVMRGKIINLFDLVGGSYTDLVVANFAFPSDTFDQELVLQELKAIYSVLKPEGKLITVGWDETFNDELNEVFYRHIPDNITATSFEEWRRKRSKSVPTPRNCSLTWLKKGITVPVEFESSDASARVMGYLFGRGAAYEIISSKKTRWLMSVGITSNSKQEIGSILREKGCL